MEPKPKKKNLDARGRQLTESAILAGVGIVFILIGNYVPIVSLLLFLSAVPVVVISYRNGLRMGFLSTVVMAILLSAFIHPLYGISMMILFFLPGMVMGYGMGKNKDPFRNIFYGFLIILGALMVYMQMMSLFFDFSIMESAKSTVEEYMRIQKEYFQGAPLDGKQILSTLQMFFPALLMISAFVIAFLNYYASASLLRRLGEKRKLGTMLEFALPGNVPLGLLLVYLVVYLISTINSPYYEVIKNSAIAIFGLLFFLQGVAVIAYFVHYMKLSGLMKALIWGSLLLLAPMSGFVSVVGLIDTAFNFRRISRT